MFDFLHDTYTRYKPSGVLLEVGGGPVLDKLFTASKHVSAIHVLEYVAENRAEVLRWMKRDDDRFDWSKCSKYVAEKLEGGVAGDGGAIEDRLRDKFVDVQPIDLLADGAAFDAPTVGGRGVAVVSSHSVAECITSTVPEWRRVFGRVMSLCQGHAGCLLVMTINTNTSWWEGGGGTVYPAACVTKELVLEELASGGFEDVFTRIHRGEVGTEMEETIGVAAMWRGQHKKGSNSDDTGAATAATAMP